MKTIISSRFLFCKKILSLKQSSDSRSRWKKAQKHSRRDCWKKRYGTGAQPDSVASSSLENVAPFAKQRQTPSIGDNNGMLRKLVGKMTLCGI